MGGLSGQSAGVRQSPRSTVTEKPIVPYKLYVVALMTLFNAVNADGVPICCITCVTPIEVVHGVTSVAGDLVETLPSAHSLLDGILIIQNLIIFHCYVDSGGKKKTPESIVEDLVSFQSGCGVVCNFNTCSEAVKDAVLAEDGVAVGADEDTSLSVSEDVVLFKQTSASIEDADPSVSSIMDLISPQSGVTVCFYPHTSHGIVKDLIILDEAQT